MKIEEFRQEVYSALPSMASMAGVKEGDNTSHPIHGSTTGSNFIVNGDQWYCFRCGTGGSKFEWIAISENRIECGNSKEFTTNNFFEILQISAEKAGIVMPSFSGSDKDDYKFSHKKREIFEESQKFFRKSLEEYPDIIEEIKERRGFSAEQIETFGFGFAPPDKHSLHNWLFSKGFTEMEMLQSGLFVKAGIPIPLFQGRITVPSFVSGKIEFFYARNSKLTPETKYEIKNGVYTKYKKLLSHNDKHSYVDVNVVEPIFGTHTIDSTTKMVFIVEGLADALSLMSWGYSVISPITTTFNSKQRKFIQRLLNHVQDLYICNDNEETNTGLNAAFKTLQLFPRAKIIELPRAEGLQKVDINDYFKTHSKSDFEHLVHMAENGWDLMASKRNTPRDFAIVACGKKGISAVRVESIGTGQDKEFRYYTMNAMLERSQAVSMRDVINLVQRSKGPISLNQLSNSEKYELMAHMISLDLIHQENSLFMVDVSNVDITNAANHTIQHIWYFDGKTAINFSKLDLYLTSRYSIINTNELKNILNLLMPLAIDQGVGISPLKMYHYDRDQNLIYFQNGPSHYFEISKDGIIEKYNGQDGILFVSSNVDEITYIPTSERSIEFKEEFFELPDWGKHLNFEYLFKIFACRPSINGSQHLSSSERRLLIFLQLFTFPFFEILSVRPIIIAHGRTKSGKSFWMENVLKLLSEKEATLHGETKTGDERTLQNILTFRPLVLIDNLDKRDPKFVQKIIGVATGQTLSTFEMYTEFGIKEKRPRPFIGFTTNSPELYTKHDLVNRSIFFEFEEIPKMDQLDEEILKGEIINNFDVLRSEYFDILQLILKEIEHGFPKTIESKTVRFAEWAKLCHAVVKSLGIDSKYYNSMLAKLDYEMMSFMAINDEEVSIIGDYVTLKGYGELSQKTFTTTTQLYEDVLEIVPSARQVWKNVSRFGVSLSKKSNVLEENYGLVIDTNERYKHFKFVDKRGQAWMSDIMPELPSTPFTEDELKQKIAKHKGYNGETADKLIKKLLEDGFIMKEGKSKTVIRYMKVMN